MLLGLTLTFLTGLIWVAVGIVFSVSAERKLDFAGFMLLCSVSSAAAAWIFIPDYGALSLDGESRWAGLLLSMGAVSVLGAAGFMAMRKAMEMGRHGMVWTIAQSSMLIPFLAGTLLWGETASGFKIGGMLLIATSLPLCASMKNGVTGSPQKNGTTAWLSCCLVAFALIGVSQVLSMIPSHWDEWQDKTQLRVPLLLLFSALIWLGVIVLQKRKVDLKQTLRLSLLYSIFVLAGQLTLYKSLDLMSVAGLSAIVYPIAIGTCIGGFYVYSIIVLKEKSGFKSGLGVASAVAGITIIALN